MKKLFAILLAVTMLASMATVVSAAETTTLTTTVPAATYTLNIPADQEIAFGATKTNIGSVSVTNASNFAVGKNVEVTLTYDAFTSENVSTTIPFSVRIQDADDDFISSDDYINLASGDAMTFLGKSDGSVYEFQWENYSAPNGQFTRQYDATMILINSADWGKAMAGEYTATITFTAEVVVG
jgi:hypothetical protein